MQTGIKKDFSKIINRAISHGMTVSIDPQWDPEEKWDLDIKKLGSQIDFSLPNDAEFLQFTGAATVEERLQEFKIHARGGNIIVKRGVKGATFLQNNKINTIPAFRNDGVIDAIGAGDSFNAGFIYRFLEGDSVEKCVKFGNLTGAVSTTQAGGTAAITSLENVLNIKKNKFLITNFDEITR